MRLIAAAGHRANGSYRMAPGSWPLASNYSLAPKIADVDWLNIL